MSLTGGQLHFTMYYQPKDEVLQTQWSLGQEDVEDTFVALNHDQLTGPMGAYLDDISTKFALMTSSSCTLIGFAVNQATPRRTGTLNHNKNIAGALPGSSLPNNTYLLLNKVGSQPDPPNPPITRTSRMMISGLAATSQSNGRFQQAFFDGAVADFIASIHAGFVEDGGGTLVHAMNKYPVRVDTFFASPVVGSFATRTANRRPARSVPSVP